MKVDSPHIDKQALAHLLKAEYGMDIASIEFMPAGEESYGYIAVTGTEVRYFVKVYENQPPADLAEQYRTAHILHTQCGLNYVVQPYPTGQGKFLAGFENYTVAVFDFIDGTTYEQGGFNAQDWTQIATRTALLHQSIHCPSLPQLANEQFELWFKDWLLQVLRAAEATHLPKNEYQRQARVLLTREKHDILGTLKKLERLAGQVLTMTYEPALTHGDLKPENWIKDSQGKLHLIDWGKLSFAPPERDLINFTGAHFTSFLRQYKQECEYPPKLYPELFEYYSYFLLLWGIADYGSWILLEEVDLGETAHAWQELAKYLPIDHQTIRAEINKVTQLLSR